MTAPLPVHSIGLSQPLIFFILLASNTGSTMVDQDALMAALVEARALDTTYSGPKTHSLILPPTRLGLGNPARERIARGLLDYTNAGELFGLLMPCGDARAETFDVELAASWLVGEARRRPASEVVADFAEFLDRREVEGLKVNLIHGLQIAATVELGASLRLEPFADLPNSWQKDLFAQRHEFERQGFDRLGEPVALTSRFPVSPGLTNRQDKATFERLSREDVERQSLMNAVPLLLTILGHGAPVVSGCWSQVTGRGVPSLGSHEYAMGLEDLGLMARAPLRVDPAEAQKLIIDFVALPQTSRTRLQVPLRHLNRSRRQYTPEAAAIDLRTALEALLAPAAGPEITFRVSLLGAWMLGRGDIEERQRIYHRLRKAYGMGSQAVHKGKSKKTTHERLSGKFNLMRLLS